MEFCVILIRIYNIIDYKVISNLRTSKNKVDITNATVLVSIKRPIYANKPFMPRGRLKKHSKPSRKHMKRKTNAYSIHIRLITCYYLPTPGAVRHSGERIIDAIHFYIQPFVSLDDIYCEMSTLLIDIPKITQRKQINKVTCVFIGSPSLRFNLCMIR